MIGVMFCLNWRFTLIALSIVAGAVRRRLCLHAADQDGVARRAQEGRRAAVRRRGGADVDSRRAGVRARGLRGTPVRVGEPGRTSRPGCRRAASRPSCRRSSRSSSRSARAWCSATARRLALRRRSSAPACSIVFLLYLGKMYKPMRDLSKMTDTVAEGVGRLRAHSGSARRSRAASAICRTRGRRRRSRARSSSTASASATTARAPVLSGRQLPDRAGPGRGDRRPVRRRQDDDREPDPALLRSAVRSGRASTAPTSAQFTLKSLRDQISFVLQDTLLFRAHDLGEHRLRPARRRRPRTPCAPPRLANAHEFIVDMPAGLRRRWSASAA